MYPHEIEDAACEELTDELFRDEIERRENDAI